MQKTASRRNSDQTRENLIQAAYWEMYRHGFRSASIDRILAGAGVTKGALYHHFPSKAALGYAVVDEVIGELIYRIWIQPLESADSPIDALLASRQAMEGGLSSVACQLGCPLNNLAQEMSPIDEGFRQRLNGIFQLWRESIAKALRQGQQQDQVRSDVDPNKSAAFIIAAVEGGIGMAKNAQNPEPWEACAEGLQQYVEGLRNSAPREPR